MSNFLLNRYANANPLLWVVASGQRNLNVLHIIIKVIDHKFVANPLFVNNSENVKVENRTLQ